MTVYVCQDDGRRPLAPLDEYGETVTLFGRSLYPDDAEDRIGVMRNIAVTKLSRFNPNLDYLLCNGDPVGIALAASILARTPLVQLHGFIRALKYDKMHRGYYMVKVPL